jgi:hypothetical protein
MHDYQEENKTVRHPKKDTSNYKDDCQTVKSASHQELLQLYIEKNASAHSLSNV